MTVLVDHDVKAEDLEAHVVVDITGVTRPVVVDKIRLDRDQSLDDDVSHLRFESLNVDSCFRHFHVHAV